ncbi:ribonuclease E/G [Pseudooceanicola sp.]|uniref:Rne/Rng family ribonuclease n=1 Tax=Pseudooceanicola sp. TaxID=1914328 RepID=UPI0026289D16|nr:ribonuclease E/G [Pseudooceanicola sp.]MDF1854055.1 ribonuclease E/G [Pseudooceanicola sp.]
MLIDATHAEETRVVVVDGNKVEEFDFESENKRQLAGNIYLAKVTRVEPSLQAAFIDYGGNRHGFLAFSEIHPDYYQIPVADREALMEEERADAEAASAREDQDDKRKRPSRSRSRSRPAKADSDDAVATLETDQIDGMETIDLDDEVPEGSSPMENVAETPVEEPDDQSDAVSDGDSDDDGDELADAASRDSEIEDLADEDDQEDIRPVRKPRARRYKIQEVIKVRQILLVQVVKEERGNKGAALTTYLSLAGRYCVLMPNTARGGGISRKITNAVDRKKLKEIANEIDVPRGAGLIVRTAGAKRTKTEIKRDYEYLQRMWEQIRELTLKSVAPAKIYEEGDLIKRSIRDLYSREIDEVLVEGERGYRNAKDFMKMIMPSHAKNVKNYQDTLPLFARFQVESYLGGMFNPVVQLKSGGYIVIGVTEALVAIDVNSGRATKEGSIEQTALNTNLEAAEEVARQLRLRDLAGLIVIDFIDMDERKNNAAVEKRMKDKLKTDRARIQVGRISGFGLMEMSRQRLRPGMIEATTQPCHVCHGTGLIRSDDNMALSILRQIEEEGTRRRSREVLVKCPVGIANYLMNQKREHVATIEGRYGMAVRIEGDPLLVSPDFTLEKLKTATRIVQEIPLVVSANSSYMDEADDDVVEEKDEDEVDAAAEAEAAETGSESSTGNGADGENGQPKKKRRRRRRRKSKSGADGNPQNGESADNGEGDESDEAEDQADIAPVVDAPVSETPAVVEAAAEAPVEPVSETPAEPVTDETEAEAPAAKPKTSRAKTTRSRSTSSTAKTAKKPATRSRAKASDAAATEDAAEAVRAEAPASEAAEAPAKPAAKPRTRTRAAAKPKAAPAPEPVAEAPAPEPVAETPAPEPVAEAPTPEPMATPAPAPEPVATPAPEPAPVAATPAPEPVAAAPAPEPVAESAPAEADDKPKKRGWWSLGR